MANWWEVPYKGGPMVAVPGFPRVIDLSKGVPDGPDVEAYKRTVWRAGRWPGPASGFDDTYNKAFAMGSGPNVVNTGVAGVQRQMKMSASGIIDEKMFNTLRSILVPEGPHAGEHAMDANAQNLIGKAYQQFKPKPPAKSKRETALEEAAKYLGYKEYPA